MKKTFRTLAVLCLLLAPAAAGAQSLGDLVKSVTGNGSSSSSSTSSVLGNVVNSVLGTQKVSAEALVGTWSYTEPAVVLESDNVLNKLGGSVATSQLENKMQTTLNKYGFTKGKVKLTFAEDGTFTCATATRKIKGTYTVDGSNLVLKKTGMTTGVKTNVNLSGGTLQLAVEADKVLTLMNTVGGVAAKANSSLSTVTTLLKNYDGMQMGMKFAK